LLEDVDNPAFIPGAPNANQSNLESSKEAPIGEYQVDVRCFAIFIALQLYASTAASEKSSTFLEKDSWGVKENSSLISQGASPRSKVAKLNTNQSKY